MSVTTLTKRLVATAQPKDRAYELRDTQVRGLLLRVRRPPAFSSGAI